MYPYMGLKEWFADVSFFCHSIFCKFVVCMMKLSELFFHERVNYIFQKFKCQSIEEMGFKWSPPFPNLSKGS